MESTCFGFEEDEPAVLDNSSTTPATNFVKPTTTFRFLCKMNPPSKPTHEMAANIVNSEGNCIVEQSSDPVLETPVSITQVQELLLQDLNPSQFESVMNSTTNNETSFYEDEDEDIRLELSPIKAVTKKGRAKETDKDSTNNPIKRKRIAKKNTKKMNDNIENENTAINETENKTPSKTPIKVHAKYVRNKKPLEEIQNFDDHVDTPIVKSKNVGKKKGKAKNIQDENNEKVDKIAEEINSKFKQVEEFQLLVE